MKKCCRVVDRDAAGNHSSIDLIAHTDAEFHSLIDTHFHPALNGVDDLTVASGRLCDVQRVSVNALNLGSN